MSINSRASLPSVSHQFDSVFAQVDYARKVEDLDVGAVALRDGLTFEQRSVEFLLAGRESVDGRSVSQGSNSGQCDPNLREHRVGGVGDVGGSRETSGGGELEKY
jgi:hypothetical protein